MVIMSCRNIYQIGEAISDGCLADGRVSLSGQICDSTTKQANPGCQRTLFLNTEPPIPLQWLRSTASVWYKWVRLRTLAMFNTSRGRLSDLSNGFSIAQDSSNKSYVSPHIQEHLSKHTTPSEQKCMLRGEVCRSSRTDYTLTHGAQYTRLCWLKGA